MKLLEMTCTAQPGFFAIYKEDDSSLFYEPIIGWGKADDAGHTFACAVVLDREAGLDCPEGCANFVGYRSPNEIGPDGVPTWKETV